MSRLTVVAILLVLVLAPATFALPTRTLTAGENIKPQSPEGVVCQMCVQEAVAMVNLLLNGIIGKELQTCSQVCECVPILSLGSLNYVSICREL